MKKNFCNFENISSSNTNITSTSTISIEHIMQLLSSADCNTMSSEEDVLQYIKKLMIRQSILKQYGAEIKQLPPTEKNGVTKAGRFYVRLPGKGLIYKTKRKDIEDVLVTYYQEEVPQTRTLTTVYQDWLALRKHEVCPRSIAKNIRYWEKYFSNYAISSIPLTELDRVNLKEWAYTIIKENSMKQKYYYNVASMLNSLLDFSVDKKYLSQNPYRGTKIKKSAFTAPSEKKEFEDVFTKAEQTMVMQEADMDSRNTCTAIPLGICILFLTGIRDGELSALKYKDIDFDNKYLHIQRMQVPKLTEDSEGKYLRDGHEIVEHTKTEAGNRKIPLTKQTIELFNRIKKLNQDLGYDTSPDSYIFMRSKNRIATPRSFDDRLRKYCRKAKMDFIKSPHDIRRTYITCLLDNGVNIEKVRRIAGHATIEMTMKYVRNRDTDITEQLENILSL